MATLTYSRSPAHLVSLAAVKITKQQWTKLFFLGRVSVRLLTPLTLNHNNIKIGCDFT